MNKKAMGARITSAAVVILTSISTVSPAAIYAEEPSESSLFEETIIESSATGLDLIIDEKYVGNTTQVRHGDSFEPIVQLTISGASIKNAVLKQLNIPSNINKRASTIEGLKDIKASITLTLKSKTEPFQVSNPNPVITTPNNDDITLLSPMQQPALVGLENLSKTVEFDVKLGELLSNPHTYAIVSSFEENENFKDLDLNISWGDCSFINLFERPTNVTLTASASCTLRGDFKTVYVVDKKDSWGNDVQETKEENVHLEDSNSLSFYDKTHTIAIVDKPNNKRPSTANKPSNKPNDITIPDTPSEVLRLYNPATGEHLFTSSEAEKINLVSHGWKVEKCSWKVPVVSDTPIFRLYNPNNGDHHYTTNASEKDTLVNYGWLYEGRALYSADKGEGIPVYRVYNPNAKGTGSHHYSESLEECNALQNLGWNFEGVAWFGITK